MPQFSTITLLALGFILFVSVSISQNILPLLQHIISVMKIISAGNLEQRIGFSGSDEFGQIGSAVDSTINQLISLISKVSSTANAITEQTANIETSSTDTRHDLQAQHEQIVHCSSAIYQMTQTATEAADKSNQADQLAKDSCQIVDTMQEELAGLIKRMETLSRDMNESSDAGKALRQTSDQVKGVLDVITGISEQTNLLALNAAIEAARAGEAGRGFAVVADEVRTLSIKTQEATVEIQAMISNLEETSETLLVKVDSGAADASSMTENFLSVKEHMQSTTANIVQISDLNALVASGANEQSKAAELMSSDLNNIQTKSVSSVEKMQEVLQGNSILQKTSQELVDALEQYRNFS